MKFAKVTKSLALGLALLLASGAFAATKGTLQISSPTNVNGTKLQPGEYKLQWEGSGPNVELSILQGKNVVAKTPARIVELGSAAPYNAAVTMRHNDGSASLTGVRLEGKKFSLELGEASDGMQAGSSK